MSHAIIIPKEYILPTIAAIIPISILVLFAQVIASNMKYNIKDINDFGQIYRENPITGLSLVICALSMIGLPPFAGFFSKWYLALGAIQSGHYFYVAVLILSSLLGAIYFFRIIEKIFMEEKTSKENGNVNTKVLELPWQMILPLLVCAVAIIAIGLGNSFIVNNITKLHYFVYMHL